MNSLGKNGYSLAFGGSDLSRILLFNDPTTPNDGIIKKQDETKLKYGYNGEVVVPRDFMIKTAYERKRRNTATAPDSLSTRSKQSSAVSFLSKNTQ